MTHFIVFFRIPALILGAETRWLDVDDFNNAGTGEWLVYSLSNIANVPPTATNGGRLSCKVNNNCSYQLYHEDGGNLFYRNRWYSNAWTPWARVDNFRCSTPSALAELLGVDINNFHVVQAESTFSFSSVPNGMFLYIEKVGAWQIYVGLKNAYSYGAAISFGYGNGTAQNERITLTVMYNDEVTTRTI